MSKLRILYGIQATGNGHIARARALVPKFRAAGADVTCLFSGRKPEEFFGMEEFEPYEIRKGLTFISKDGRISYSRTIRNIHGNTLMRDVKALDLSGADVIITDYEPITAWAAKLADRETVGIANQCAYEYDIPTDGMTFASEFLIKNFAPATKGLGQHWHHFDQPILPPIVHAPEPAEADPAKIVVYMAFEEPKDLVRLVSSFNDHRFYIYTPQVKEPREEGNVILRPPSRAMQADLVDCAGVICNSGFQLPSELLQMGKKMLVKPMGGQMEQLSNAKVIRDLRLGDVMDKLDRKDVERWLNRESRVQIAFPDVAQAIVDWVLTTDRTDVKPLAQDLWRRTVRTESSAPRL